LGFSRDLSGNHWDISSNQEGDLGVWKGGKVESQLKNKERKYRIRNEGENLTSTVASPHHKNPPTPTNQNKYE